MEGEGEGSALEEEEAALRHEASPAPTVNCRKAVSLMLEIIQETHRTRPGLISSLIIDDNYSLGTSRKVGLPCVGVAGERVRLEQGIGLARVHGRNDCKSKDRWHQYRRVGNEGTKGRTGDATHSRRGIDHLHQR